MHAAAMQKPSGAEINKSCTWKNKPSYDIICNNYLSVAIYNFNQMITIKGLSL